MKTKMAQSSSLLLRISLILEIIGFILHLIGFTTPYWRSLHFKYTNVDKTKIDLLIQGFDEGLWRRCVNGLCAGINISGRDWLQAVRVFESVAIVTSLIGVILIVSYFFTKRFHQNKRVLLVSVVSCFITAGTIMLATITYGSSVKTGITWSFGLVVFGGACFAISGFMMLVTYYTMTRKN